MASLYVRQTIRDEMTANWALTPWFDLSDYVSIDDLPIPDGAAVVLLEFMPSSDDLVAIGGGQQDSCYRENGSMYFHYLIPTGDPSMSHLTDMKSLTDMFKNKRFGTLIVENVDPFSDQFGAAIQVDGPWHGWSSNCAYYTDTFV